MTFAPPLSFAGEIAAMHQEVVVLDEPVSDSKSTSTNPVGTFDEVIMKASEGDTLRCVDVSNSELFLYMEDYLVIRGEQLFSKGHLTFVDEVGLEVPRIEEFTVRKELSDKFMLIPKVDERVEMLNNLRTKRDIMIADAQSIEVALTKLDEFDADWHTPFGLMSDTDKGALLLADSEGKTIQAYLKGWDVAWVVTDDEHPVWNPDEYYRVKPLSYGAVKSALDSVTSEIADVNSEIRELELALDAW